MGYQVYEDQSARDCGVERWAGYGVPAICDWPDCDEKIDRGLGHKCEEHGAYRLMLDGEEISYDRFDDEPDAEEDWTEAEGCGLYFCEDHLYRHSEHEGIEPKPDTAEWVQWMLTDESWAQWREENTERVEKMREAAA